MQTRSQKGLYKRVLFLAIPMALQNIITFSIGLADNLMVGSLGEFALSGAFVVNQVQNLLHMLVMGLGAAMTVLVTQYWGKKDLDSIKIILGIALKSSIVAGIALFLATSLFPNQIIKLFSYETEVITEGLKYLNIIRFTYVFFCITQVLIASMRCIETVKVGMYISLVTFVINVSLNWVFIFGHLGAPALGIEGAAIATLIARIVETFLIIIYVRFMDSKLNFRFKDLLKNNLVLVKDFFKYGTPIISGDVLWGLNIAVQGAIIGRLGATALASVSIANTVFSIVGVAVYGTAGASAVVIGQTVGLGEYDTVKEYAKKLQILFLIIGIFSGFTLFVVKDYVLLLYNVSEETIFMATQFLTVLSITIVGTSYQMSSLTGIVRAGGSIHFVLINDLIFVWLVVIPSALIAAFVFHAPPVIVFFCLKSDQILKCAVAVVKVNRFTWIKNLTRDTEII
ncbi:MAG: MATE family efflux transporter [Epulopiscium sp.]|nr:MATE family efflux transporter [Candidatus Epulonipiscium sp.]